jgi:hypothetical protein
MLLTEMKKGVYAVKLFDELTSLEADEMEYLLIRKIKQSKPCFLYVFYIYWLKVQNWSATCKKDTQLHELKL